MNEGKVILPEVPTSLVGPGRKACVRYWGNRDGQTCDTFIIKFARAAVTKCHRLGGTNVYLCSLTPDSKL